MERGKLSRERVLDAALALVDEIGVKGLTMRRLGAEIGVEAMTLYYYVPNKEALLDGLVERVLSRAVAEPPAPGTPWRSMLREAAVGYRRELLRHPGVLPLVAGRPVSGPEALQVLEAGVAVLREAGFGLREAFHAITATITFVVGHTLAEVPPPGQDEPALDTTGFPLIAHAVAEGLGAPEDHQSRFDYALDALLDGFAARLRA
ncbi:TetR/AcrR family transcriptional regulator C-terminal domain-containing protein [Streptosporangium pseudovulgare]|uniref:TetR family transcriptional regulator n=1 Tax=Streptosporangium pseudovulgare TaxID=35765 RepID=A0ABQ2QHP7_9ACTN|nr:TetR/AcrR family transcriptional regulator C-terminal domain-containing protein [Streptosporangium pseudovulgare]GGP81095.1 TetR family transcriptional regulator [Streptosporangium pseudovulgare]